MQVFRKLQSSGVQLTALVYNSLLDSCVQCNAGLPEAAVEWRAAHGACVQLAARLLRSVQCRSSGSCSRVACSSRRLCTTRCSTPAFSAMQVFRKLQSSGVQLTALVYNSLL